MKKALIITAIICTSFIGKGQNEYYLSDSSGITLATPSDIQIGTSEIKQLGYDTIPVVMLVCDTGLKKSSGAFSVSYYNNGDIETIYKVEDRIGFIWWQFGYSVREKYCCINGNTSNLAYYKAVPYFEHLYYLDDKKQPLSKNIIVWMAK